ncbi:hypothetical protein LSH36_60g05048 [Paralvinella palmiformis]|uniref:Dual oxidase maturation factor 1 n=1 Tax=Paralvinella palmiformis TaxID=53620 RepID=A0AAD9K4R4_9ANNE|nr:hypothetical protein LSH36_60g05048 [Paralvinella palmiformis]
MGWFDAFRVDPYPTQYDPRKTAVTGDVLESGLLYAICILAFSCLIIIPGWRGKQALFYFIRIVFSIFVLASILMINFGQEWEVAHLENVKIQYRAGIEEEIQADIGLKISLRNINITLKTNPERQTFNNGSVQERINYNERFSWDNEGWVQGRMGFGPNAGLFNREYRHAQNKGLPYPILWIAEYFTLDGEWIRWGRFYRQAGYYTHIMIWLSFSLWVLTLILFKMVVVYGGVISLLTGLSLLIANCIYGLMRNKNELVIPLTAEAVLDTTYGWCFWLCLINGILTLGVGIVVIVLDSLMDNNTLALFFNKDLIQEWDELYIDEKEADILLQAREEGVIRRLTKKKYKPDIESTAGQAEATTSENDQTQNRAERAQRHFRKKTIVRSADQNLVRPPRPAPRHVIKQDVKDDDDDDYENNPVAISWPLGGASGLAGRIASCVSGFLRSVVGASPRSLMLQLKTGQNAGGQMALCTHVFEIQTQILKFAPSSPTPTKMAASVPRVRDHIAYITPECSLKV